MSIALAEQLKNEWTDKYVVVDEGAPELKRFSGLTGTVRTINMNGRALVEFDGPVDISWYDIDTSYLKVIPAPLQKKAPAPAKPAPAAAAPKAAAAETAKPAGEKKLSPLELARMQGAAAKAAAADSVKKPSPLDLARQQGAAKAEVEAALVEEAVETAPAPAPIAKPAAAGGSSREKPGSTAEIIELARRQGAFKG